jgi:hypothetical protein
MRDYTVKFNAQPQIKRFELDNGKSVFVVDDVLDLPERIVQLAHDVAAEFVVAPGNAFPGCQLLMSADFSAKLDDFFRLHIRKALGGRRSLHMYARMSRVTLAPSLLDGRQRICHRDSAGVDIRNTISASVLYLFKDLSLGGTVFFEPLASPHETEQLVHDASELRPQDFEKKYGWAASYMTHSNAYFKVIGRVPAKQNRIIFYDGNIFHSSDINHPEKLNDPNGVGRLTINGFFTCTRQAS